MARTNKFKAKSASSTSASKSKHTTPKPAKLPPPAANAINENSNGTALEEPNPRPVSRRRLDKSPWADGDQPPQFAAAPSLPSALAPLPQALPQPLAPAAASRPAAPIDPLALLPPSLRDAVAGSYDLHHLPIGASAKITAKVTALLALLENEFSLAQTGQKPAVVAVTARAPFANRMLSVVEIAKRELVGRKSRWFQYSAVVGRVEEMKSEGKGELRHTGSGKTAGGLGGSGEGKENEAGLDVEMGDETGGGEDEEEEEDAFEPIRFEAEERTKVRAVPVMTVYLSRVPIPELKAEFGEQTFDPRPPLVL